MAKANSRPAQRRPALPGARPTASRPAFFDPDKLPWIVILLFVLHAVLMCAIEIAMTPYTNNLDDIKQSIFFCGAPVLMVIAIIGIMRREVPLPTRWLGRGLAAYFIIMVVSTLYMSSGLRQHGVPGTAITGIRWMGWDQVQTVWCAIGLFLSALAMGSHEKSNYRFVRYLVLQWLLVNIIGYMMFDILTPDKHMSVVAWVFDNFFSKDQGAWGQLLVTLRGADNQLQSSILNRDFYAGLSLLFLPFCLLLALEPGPSRHPYIWRTIGGINAFVTTMSVFLCQSKGEYIFWVVMVAYFLGMFVFFGYTAGLRRRHLVVSMASCGLVLLVFAWMKSPTLMNNLKSVSLSASSRWIMWSAAGKIWKDFPFIGGGPGSFRVYFSSYRAPDYYMHEIANVTTYAHNYFLDLLAEEGLLGFCAFVLFLSALWFGGLRNAIKHADGRTRMVMIACTASLIGMFGSNLSSPNARWIIGATNLWTVMGFFAGSLRLASGWKPRAADFSPVQKRADFGRYVIAAVAIIAVPVMVVCIKSGSHYWTSAKAYAVGFQYMDMGMSPIARDESDLEGAKDHLNSAAYYFEQAIAADPTNVSAYYKVGSVYSTLDRIYGSDAMQANRPGNGAQVQQLMAVADDYSRKAMERYATLDSLMPDYAEVNYNFGIVYQRMGELVRRQAQMATSPEIAQSLLAQGNTYDEKSREHLERMHQESIKPEVYTLLGGVLTSRGSTSQALAMYKEGITRHPDDIDLLKRYHDVATVVDPIASVEALRMLWRQDGYKTEYLRMMIQVCIDGRFAQELGNVANDLFRINPIDPRVYSSRMMLAEWNNDLPGVLAEADRYIKCNGAQPQVIQRAVKAATQLGKGDKAAEYQQYMQKISQRQVPPASAPE